MPINNNWKKPTNQEMIDYYKSEIKRFEEQGGIGAELNLPGLKSQLKKYEK